MSNMMNYCVWQLVEQLCLEQLFLEQKQKHQQHSSRYFQHSFRLSLVVLLHFYHIVVKLLPTPHSPNRLLCLFGTLVSR